MSTILTQSLYADIFIPSCSTSIGTFFLAISTALVPQYPQEGVVHVLKCSGKVRVIPRGRRNECPYAVIVNKDLLQNPW